MLLSETIEFNFIKDKVITRFVEIRSMHNENRY